MTNIPFSCIVKPVGARCNLRCEHCFYLEKEVLYDDAGGGVMSEETLETFIRDYTASQPDGIEEINFVWQGGEPTLAGLDFFRRAVELEKKYVPSRIRVLNSLQTNGTLLDDEWGKFLHERGFLVGISIDGPENLHDRFRLDARGRGSFNAVMGGLETLQRNKVEFNVLTCVQSDNAGYGKDVYDFLKSLGAVFMQFIPIIEHWVRPPYPADPRPPDDIGEYKLTERSVSGKQFGRFMIDVFDHWLEQDDVGRIFIQLFDAVLGLMFGYPAAVCVYSRRCGRGLVVEHNGDVYACDHYVFPEYRLGNLKEVSLKKIADDSRLCKFGAAKETALPRTCLDCHFLSLCHGGCPAHRIDFADDGSPGMNCLCSGYRMFHQHAMPVMQAMGRALRQGRKAADWKAFF